MISITTTPAAYGRASSAVLNTEGPGFYNGGFPHRVNLFTDAEHPTLNPLPAVISAHGGGVRAAGTVRIGDLIEVDGTAYRLTSRPHENPVLLPA